MKTRSPKVMALLTLPLFAALLGLGTGTLASESLESVVRVRPVEAIIESVRDLMRPTPRRAPNVTFCALPAMPIVCQNPATPLQSPVQNAASGVQFSAVDIFLTPTLRADGTSPELGAWQVEYTGSSDTGEVLLVGVEGGEHDAYAEPAFYDPEALAGGRVILAAYAVEGELPSGRTRIARLHLQSPAGGFESAVTLIAAGDAGGERIEAAVEAVPVEAVRPNVPATDQTTEDTAHTEG